MPQPPMDYIYRFAIQTSCMELGKVDGVWRENEGETIGAAKSWDG